jgi:uncharacterized protein
LFDSPPLDEAFDVLGAPVVEIDVASDRPRANLIVRLCDVHPAGASLRFSYGVLNLTHRGGHEAPAPMVPSQRTRVRIQLNDAGFRFPAGHRIRLAMSTTYWPMVWPAPEMATVTVFTRTGTLLLPIRPAQPNETNWQPPPPETASPAARTVLREGRSRREGGCDVASGESFSRAIEEPSLVRIDAIGIDLGNEGSSECSIRDDDPLSARAELRRSQTVGRGDWQVRTELRLRVSSTADEFRLRVALEAFEGDATAYRREWDEAIPRGLL